jgi:hypothetical protein
VSWNPHVLDRHPQLDTLLPAMEIASVLPLPVHQRTAIVSWYRCPTSSGGLARPLHPGGWGIEAVLPTAFPGSMQGAEAGMGLRSTISIDIVNQQGYVTTQQLR